MDQIALSVPPFDPAADTEALSSGTDVFLHLGNDVVAIVKMFADDANDEEFTSALATINSLERKAN